MICIRSQRLRYEPPTIRDIGRVPKQENLLWFKGLLEVDPSRDLDAQVAALV